MWLEDQDEQELAVLTNLLQSGRPSSDSSSEVERACLSSMLRQLLPMLAGSGGLLWAPLDPVTLSPSKTRTVEPVAGDNGLH